MLHAPPSDEEPTRCPASATTQRVPGKPVGGERSEAAAAVMASGAASGTAVPPGSRAQGLAGRRIGLICASRQAPAAALFIEAAEGLGAQVAVLHAADVMDAGAAQQDKLVRMLSRLYDVIECQDLPSAAVRHIAELVAVPVLANLGARALGQDAPPASERGMTERGVPERGMPERSTPERGTPEWEQGLSRVRQALLSAL